MRTIRIRFQNGITKESALRDILYEVAEQYTFEESDHPDFILFGPYGRDIPGSGNYTRIGYYCENMTPDLAHCEWAFGILPEEKVGSARYKRIQWHGLEPQRLVKPAGYDPAALLRDKKRFCNFLYSNRVPYREEFFRQLSRYKKVDAPGRSMHNMPSIDPVHRHDPTFWERKRSFLSNYKFTIAFENYVSPGYQTEKLFDAMLADSIPVYCGDPLVGAIFNTQSFINVPDLLPAPNRGLVNWLEEVSRPAFRDILPRYHKGPLLRARRRLKAAGRTLNMRYQFGRTDFTPVIERIIELDQNDDQYTSLLRQPWLNGNAPPAGVSLKRRWQEIFDGPA